MSREYTIKLNEEEINKIQIALENYDYSFAEHKDIVRKFTQAKQKPYTNFDKIKDEMTIDDINECIQKTRVYDKQVGCDNCSVGDKPFVKCIDCVKEWLESEVKE